MDQRNTPYLRLVAPFVPGIALGGLLDDAPPWLPWLLLLNIGSTLFFALRRYQYRFRWLFGANAFSCLFLAGYFLAVRYNELRQPGHFSALTGQPVYLIGTVYDAPLSGARTKIPVRIEATGLPGDSVTRSAGNLLLFVEPGGGADSLRYGDKLLIRARPQPTEPPKNPDAFDYRRYLHFQNIHFQSFTTSDSILLLARGQGNRLWAAAFGCRDRLLTLLRRHFPGNDEYAVASALLVGYKEDLSDELRTAYAETGSMHALAVSGSHVGMLYIGLLFLTQRLRLKGRWRLLETAIVLLVIWGFTFLTGATASVLRASVMFSTYLLGKAFWRNASAWNVLPASAFGLLLYNPYFLFDAGFQLSYAAVAGMVFFYPRLYKMFPPGPRWADEVLKVFLVGVAAQLGTLPLSLYYFNQFPVYFWLAGWLVVFGGAVFLWGGAVLVLLDATVPILGQWLGKALHGMLWGLNRAIVTIQHLPGSVIADVWIPAWVTAALYAALVLLGLLLVWRRGRWLAGFFGLMGILGVYRIGTLTRKQNQHAITVYSLPRQKRLIDFFDGDRVVALSDSLSAKQELFTAKGHRVACAIRQKQVLYLDSLASMTATNLLIDRPFIRFYGQTIALIDRADWLETTAAPTPVDILLISKNAAVTIQECMQRFPFRIAVFDASNSRKKNLRWVQECKTNGWPCHDIRTQGAWLFHF